MTPTPKASHQEPSTALTMPSPFNSVESAELTDTSLSGPTSAPIVSDARGSFNRRRFFQAASALSAVALSETFGPLARGLAAEPTPSGKVTAVDADKATIAVGDATFTVHKSAQIKVNGKRGKLRDVEPGMVVTLTFNSPRSPVRVVSKIEASGTREEPGTGDLPKGPVQTDSRLAELPKAFIQRSPDISAHTLYWTSQETPTSASVLWRAVRDSLNGSFSNPEPLFPAIECAQSGGVNVVLFNGGPLLHAGRTAPPHGQLSRPRPISDVKKHGLLRSPRFSALGAENLYCERVDGTNIQLVVFGLDKSGRDIWDFDAPTEIQVPANFAGRLRNFCPLANKKALACLQDQRTPGPTVFLLSGGNGSTSFTACEPVVAEDPRIGDVRGFSPATDNFTELYLTGLGPAKGGPAAFIFKVKVKDLRES